MLPAHLIMTSGTFLCFYIKPIDAPVNTRSTDTRSAYDICHWAVGGPERRDCPHHDSYHWKCLARIKNCSSDTDYHCAKDLNGNWIEICDKFKVCHEGEEPQMVNGEIRCGYCEDRERYNPLVNKPSNEFSQCPNQKGICDSKKNGKVECDEPYKTNDPYSKHKMDRKCMCDYKNNFRPRFYNFEKDTWKCIIASELLCDNRPCDSKDGVTQSRGEDYRCHPEVTVRLTKTTSENNFTGNTNKPTLPTVLPSTPSTEKRIKTSTLPPTEKTTKKPDKQNENTKEHGHKDVVVIAVVSIFCLGITFVIITVYLIKHPRVINNAFKTVNNIRGHFIKARDVHNLNGPSPHEHGSNSISDASRLLNEDSERGSIEEEEREPLNPASDSVIARTGNVDHQVSLQEPAVMTINDKRNPDTTRERASEDRSVSLDIENELPNVRYYPNSDRNNNGSANPSNKSLEIDTQSLPPEFLHSGKNNRLQGASGVRFYDMKSAKLIQPSDRNNSSLRSVTGNLCSNPQEVKNFFKSVMQSLKDEKEQLDTIDRLVENCKSLQLRFRGKTPGNGNCFFEAVASQLQRLGVKNWNATVLRRRVVQFLENNRVFQTSEEQVNIEKYVLGRFEEWCEKMRKDGEYADHPVVFGMARMLQMDIMIVTSSPTDGPHDNIAWIVGREGFSGSPILLGHEWEYHYQSLEPESASDHPFPAGNSDIVQIESRQENPPGFQPYQSFQELPPGPELRINQSQENSVGINSRTLEPNTLPEVEDIYKRVLNKNIRALKRELSPCTLDCIIEAEIGSQDQHMDIKEIPKTREKNEKIVELIMRKGFDKYKHFKTILWKTNQKPLLDALEKTEKELLEEVIPEKVKESEEDGSLQDEEEEEDKEDAIESIDHDAIEPGADDAQHDMENYDNHNNNSESR